jgi:S-methylmethionine-dependent homocysteine/selenocysteine methylase
MNARVLPGAPQIFLTDGGIETTLIFDDGLDLPHFAAFDLLRTREGRHALERYYEPYIRIARRDERGFILESPTWRASADWGERLGYSKRGLAQANVQAINLLFRLRERHQGSGLPMLVSGCVGPRGDGYVAEELMPVEVAEAYHDEQIAVLAESGAELVTAITMTNVEEAAGIVCSAQRYGLPCVISFTVETNGRLPTGHPLGEAIAEVDELTDTGPAYYMINCAHPTHIRSGVQPGARWLQRVQGLRVNASCKSHEELDAAEDLDRGDPLALADDHRELVELFPRLRVFGGCCGTGHQHVAAISKCVTA